MDHADAAYVALRKVPPCFVSPFGEDEGGSLWRAERSSAPSKAGVFMVVVVAVMGMMTHARERQHFDDEIPKKQPTTERREGKQQRNLL